MKKLTLVFCFAIACQIYGQTFQESKIFTDIEVQKIKDSHQDLMNLNQRFINNGKMSDAYRAMMIKEKTEHVLTLLNTCNSLGFIFSKSSKDSKISEMAQFSLSSFLAHLEMLIFQINTTLIQIESSIDKISASGPIVFSNLRDELRLVLRKTKKLQAKE